MDKWDNWVNRVSDTDALWWPVVSWRPPKDVAMGAGLCARYFVLCLSACFLVILVLGAFLLTTVRFLSSDFDHTGFTFLQVLWWNSGWLLAHYGLSILGGLTAYCLVMFWGFVGCWNRRANRLAQTREEAAPTPPPPDNVWPPPPSRQGASRTGT